MRRRLALTAAAAAVALTAAACDLNIEPTNVTGKVAARSMQFNAATKHWQYYLTVGGQTFRVYVQTYNDCPTGSTYPKCEQ